MTASSLLVANSRWRSLGVIFLVIAAGCGFLVAWEGRPNPDRMFILAFLVVLCRLGASLARRYTIGDLMVLTAAVAVVLCLVRRTELIHRDAVYWVGTLSFAITMSFVMSSQQWEEHLYVGGLLGIAVLATIGFAAADAHWVQPDRLEFQAALVRYAAFSFGMISPASVYRMCRLAIASKPKIHELASATPGCAITRSISNDDPSGAPGEAVGSIEPNLRIVEGPSSVCTTTR